MPVPKTVRQRYEAHVPLDRLTPHPANPNHGDLGLLSELVEANGFAGAVLAQESTGLLIDGEHRWRTALAEGMTGIPVLWLDVDDDARDRLLASINESTRKGRNDEGKLIALLSGLAATPRGLEGTAYDGDDLDALIAAMNGGAGGDGEGGGERPSLADRFLIPPFDVLDARAGWWQARKKAWIGLGIRSEIGRSGRLVGSASTGSGGLADASRRQRDQYSREDRGLTIKGQDSLISIKPNLVRQPGTYTRAEEKGLTFKSADGRDPTYYQQKNDAEARLGRSLTKEEFEASYYQPSSQYESGTSIFDPVLCELAYRWFCPPAGHVLDPFAGGSVRGLMAAMLGRRYTGNDLSAEQIKANQEQADDFTCRDLISEPGAGDRPPPAWTAGDSAQWVTTLEPESFDLLFTCPPYLWLEKYSDDPADLSSLSAEDFETAYTRIIYGAARALREDRFAVIVTGDVRHDRTGTLVDFRGMTIRAAAAAGLALVSGAVLVTPVGSLAVRAGRAFTAARTLGRSHQDVLCFVKGSRSRAATACGDVDIALPEEINDAFTPDAPAT